MCSIELEAITKRNIRQALRDYGAHTSKMTVLEDVSDIFIERLAKDSIKAKRDLRGLLRKSPAWNEELQAVVINGTRTHDPDFARVHRFMHLILERVIADSDSDTQEKIYAAMRFFDSPDLDPTPGIAAIKELAPKAYRASKKKSRVFKSLCDALGVTDEARGSEFQRLFAMFADELNGKKLDFKLYLSINPAHFVTMSNPKNDQRGSMLTSCHSFNSTEYPYNCGCAGYARDEVTMIAFTADNPNKPETLNNRKTSRQLFMYKVGNGLLLQSRMYDTGGGTYGAQKESALYRDLVQRELSELEGVPNLWETRPYFGNSLCLIHAGGGFGGYCDWNYKEFDAKLSIRHDHAEDFKSFTIGTYGLCVSCGIMIDGGMYCHDCGGGKDTVCDFCDEFCCETYSVINGSGDYIQVCETCRDEHFRYCRECEDYYPVDDMFEVSEDEWVCRNCFNEYYGVCDECHEYCHNDDAHHAYNRHGCEVWICSDCRDAYYYWCVSCDELYHEDALHSAHGRDGSVYRICEHCRDEFYEACDECGEYFLKEMIEDGLCPNCRDEQ